MQYVATDFKTCLGDTAEDFDAREIAGNAVCASHVERTGDEEFAAYAVPEVVEDCDDVCQTSGETFVYQVAAHTACFAVYGYCAAVWQDAVGLFQELVEAADVVERL